MFSRVFGLSGPWPRALIFGPRISSSTSSYLRSSHYDQGLWVYGLFKLCQCTHATCTCFKETALLFNVLCLPAPLIFFLALYYEHIMNICFSSKFALRIPSVFSSFLHAI